jgi:D-inositol-3-phosphate glycosyltransferase
MKNLLWIGDAACGSGFGRATEGVLAHLAPHYNPSVIGINFRGDPPYPAYPVYPAWTGGDALGLGRLNELMPKIQPDLVVIQSNPWNIPVYIARLREALKGRPMPRVVGVIAVEGKNCRGHQLNQLDRAIFWNEFSRKEATAGGMSVPSSVIPLGVDEKVFCPGDRTEARTKLGLGKVPNDAFIVGNVNRNQNRKRLDLSVAYFAQWVKESGVRDAFLYLHVLPGSSSRCDCDQLAGYYGIQDRLILSEPRDIFRGVPEEYVVATYRAFDVQITTTLGEGHGLTTMEGMACRIPQVAGDYAALGEWAKDAALLVDCPDEGVMPDVQNMIGAAPDRKAMIHAMDRMYRDQRLRDAVAEAGYNRVMESRFRWSNIAQQFADEICR